MRFLSVILAAWAATWGAFAAEVMPPKPDQYFNDYAQVVSPAIAADLNRELEEFERDTSSQILVVVYPKMESDSSIEDYTVRVAQSWGVGQKGKDSGAVLFVFVQDHQIYMQIGYGLEGALPDALARRIIQNEIKPYFAKGDVDGGLRAGVAAMLAAAKGEYKGTGQTVADRSQSGGSDWVYVLFVVVIVLIVVARLYSACGTVYSRTGRIISYAGWGGAGLWGGGFSGGGGGFSSGGGFSGGGGSFGGGGAGGSW